MHLSPQQYQSLHNALTFVYDADRLRLLLKAYVQKRLDYIVADKDFPTTVMYVIGAAQQEGWLRELIDGALDDNPDNAALDDVRAWYSSWKSVVPTDPFQVRLMYDSLPVLGRGEMKKHIEALTQAYTGARVFVVNGDPASGKTFTSLYIGYLQSNLGGFELVYVDLPRLGPSVTPEDVGRSIAGQLGFDVSTMPRLESEQEARWNHFFCDWLTGEMKRRRDSGRQQLFWLVFDECSTHTRKSITDLINELAKRVALNLDVVRLVLLHYRDADLPVNVVANVRKEAIKEIGRDDIRAFFEWVFGKVRAENEMTDQEFQAEIEESVARVLSHVQPGHPRRLELLSQAVGAEARTILQA